MRVDLNYLVLNASQAVTPLNLQGWLRRQLVAQTFDDKEDEDDVMVILFVTETCIGTLGRKKFAKLVNKAASKHEWIDEIKVVTLSAPISVEEAYMHASNMLGQRANTDMDGLGTTFLCYDSESAAEQFLKTHDVEPVCLLRQTTARDIEKIDVKHLGLTLGAWMVISVVRETVEHDDNLVISPPIATQGEAMEYARLKYGAVRFLQMPLAR
ncbi:hypothetical protein [Pseudomonas serbica]|jgi:hypothetical protein|uniref:hypothetical protein n=1 Tax=Pseudomonas serbica TaxID=2965074 RepID=UPI00237C318B|nr:hypothetical protein [Pseudomonas serbica]